MTIRTKPSSREYRENFDRIFRRKPTEVPVVPHLRFAVATHQKQGWCTVCRAIIEERPAVEHLTKCPRCSKKTLHPVRRAHAMQFFVLDIDNQKEDT